MMNRLILSGLLVFAASTLCGCTGAPIRSSSGDASTVVSPVASASATAPTTAQTSRSVTHSGNFTSGEHSTKGTVQIITENGQRFIELNADFETQQGPDLFVILHRAKDVIGSTQPPAYSINATDYVEIAPLKAIAGTQRYAIPASVNFADYQSVAIWCREFNATFGSAGLMMS